MEGSQHRNKDYRAGFLIGFHSKVSEMPRITKQNYKVLHRAGGTVCSVVRHKICICLLVQVQVKAWFYVTGNKRHN